MQSSWECWRWQFLCFTIAICSLPHLHYWCCDVKFKNKILHSLQTMAMGLIVQLIMENDYLLSDRAIFCLSVCLVFFSVVMMGVHIKKTGKMPTHELNVCTNQPRQMSVCSATLYNKTFLRLKLSFSGPLQNGQSYVQMSLGHNLLSACQQRMDLCPPALMTHPWLTTFLRTK